MIPEDFITLLTVISIIAAVHTGMRWWVAAAVGGAVLSVFAYGNWIAAILGLGAPVLFFLPQESKTHDNSQRVRSS
jgi:hypothetical protein